ncbi:hypothetical protein [Pacificispira spongiicola]|uniref:hypothetical protein n=1 Tax=Pacificispira spongiicola TaxID=2729598 RepID=UPI00146B63AC|nr:hypothetical protein [Pacificispira spongiicola]
MKWAPWRTRPGDVTVFFEKLSIRQKTALLALAKRMMIADAKIRIEEDALFTLLRAEVGAGLEPPTQDVFGKIDVSLFDDRYSQLVLLMTLAVMAFVDNHFHASESSVLNEVIARLDFDEETIAQAMAMAERQGALIREVEDFFQAKV